MNILTKIIKNTTAESRKRGVYYTLLMNLSYLIGISRGYIFKLIYFKNISSTVFSMQANSRIEIFNKNAKVSIGKFVFVRKNASFRIDFEGELNIGEKVFINDNCNINCVSKITIGRNTKIAPNVCINDHDHNYKEPGNNHLKIGEVTIGENVWIGSNVVILRNTTIGDNCVIAAGSIVNGNVPTNTLFINKRENQMQNFKSASAKTIKTAN
ncbi:acyltransferase [Litchfieldia salsa]|uniref:Transferase hexapeptide (Six repeat-containing protein) n=1 Tax=Litchfieldia salsa TaxID=930152 RepID=A0A1H0VEM7_9BACI|nr:acyltransferase [Litchfieldia salsa]SDP76814.1 transferase hexapeptide (six repeat-containing protein) [Litchfieldia salsa]